MGVVRDIQEEHLGQVRPVHSQIQGSGDMHKGTKQAEGNVVFAWDMSVYHEGAIALLCDRGNQPAWARSSGLGSSPRHLQVTSYSNGDSCFSSDG